MIAPSVSFFECIANIHSDIDADFIDQSQRAHRHAPLQQRVVDLLCMQTAFKQFSGIKQIREQDSVDEETWAVAHNDREFSDLSHKSETPLARLL